MPIADLIGQLLGGALQGAQQNIAPVMNPQAYQQGQENNRLLTQLQAQAQQRQTMTPYETAQLGLQGAKQTAEASQAEDSQNLNLLRMFQSGAVRTQQPGSTAPSVSYAGTKLEAVPPGEQAGMFTYKPTPEDQTNYPWLPASGVTMPVREFPTFLGDMSKLRKTNPAAGAAYEQTLLGQLDQVYSGGDPSTKRNLQFMIHDHIANGKPEEAVKMLDDIRKQNQEVETEKRKQALQFDPTAVQGKARIAGAEASARAMAENKASAMNLDDTTLNYWWKQVKLGAIPYSDVLSRFDKAGKERFASYVARTGEDNPVALDAPTRTRLANLEPVLNSLKDLRQKLAKTKMDQQTAPGSLLGARTLYGIGAGDPQGGLISQLEMDRLRGATQALPGGRAALRTFEQAQIHTPNAWKDSGKLMADKLDVMTQYLEDQQSKLFKYGAKSGVVQQLPMEDPAPQAAPARAPLVIPPPPSAGGAR